MRISTLQSYMGQVDQMVRLRHNVASTQAQISTGKRFDTAADDPMAAARIGDIKRGLVALTRYASAVDQAESRLAQQDVALSSISDVLQSIRDLTLQAGNGALGGDDRGFIEAELTVLLAEIESLIEARAAAGTALFGAGPVRALAIGDAATVAIDVSREVQSGSRERLRQLTSSPILRTVGARNLVRLGRLCRTVNTPSLLLKTWTVSSM